MPLIFCVELVRLEVATCIRCSLAVLGRWSYRWLALRGLSMSNPFTVGYLHH